MSGDEDHGGSEGEFLLKEINIGGGGGSGGTGGRDVSWRLNFDGFQFSSEHKEKPPRGFHDCLGVLGKVFQLCLFPLCVDSDCFI